MAGAAACAAEERVIDAREGSTRRGTARGRESARISAAGVHGVWTGGLARKCVAGKELSMSIISLSSGGRAEGQRDAVQRRRGLIDGVGKDSMWRERLRLEVAGDEFKGVCPRALLTCSCLLSSAS